MPDFDVIVIGAGAVGLACAAQLAQSGRSVLVVEAGDRSGAGTSSRNSEVIHAGIYYPHGSLKHLLCVRGRHLLYDFLAKRQIPHAKCGKLIVAADADEVSEIERLFARAQQNGVEGLRMLDAHEIQRLEPEVHGPAAILSPETGIFDSHSYMLALEAEIEEHGGVIALRAPFDSARATSARGFRVSIGGGDPVTLTSHTLVNSAGLYARHVAQNIDALAPAFIPQMRFAKGNYFAYSGRSPFRRLIYPAPGHGGLGIHATLDLNGRVRFGPDIEWLPGEQDDPDAVSYAVNAARAEAFYPAIRRYWPNLPDGFLTPDYAGCRPKLAHPGDLYPDFVIQDESAHGVRGLINLFGIESPGLTASLAIAEHVAARFSS